MIYFTSTLVTASSWTSSSHYMTKSPYVRFMFSTLSPIFYFFHKTQLWANDNFFILVKVAGLVTTSMRSWSFKEFVWKQDLNQNFLQFYHCRLLPNSCEVDWRKPLTPFAEHLLWYWLHISNLKYLIGLKTTNLWWT